MPLNSSGPISLGGATAGQSINLELGQSATATVSLNATNVRTLAGVPSGAIIMPTNFYGKSSGPTVGVYYGGSTSVSAQCNIVTRINACGGLVGTQTNVGTGRSALAGAAVGVNGLFYAGRRCGCGANTRRNEVTRINACGSLVGSQTNVGTARESIGGAPVGSNGLFYGGCGATSVARQTVTRINACGALVGSETTLTCGRTTLGGARVGSNGLFYAGLTPAFQQTNTVTRINACGAQVGCLTTAGSARQSIGGGAPVGGNGMFYGGNCRFSNTRQNTVTRINACGALVGSQTNVGTARGSVGGALVGSNGVFYGGCTPTQQNIVTRINACGALVGSQTNINPTTARMGATGL
jgi:hypothetical protein